jgi:hypothetical protein
VELGRSEENGFLSRCLSALGIEAPAGFKYTYHSLRHAAASSMAAINVHEARMLWLQGWSSKGVARSTYIDPNCPATPGCYLGVWLAAAAACGSIGRADGRLGERDRHRTGRGVGVAVGVRRVCVVGGWWCVCVIVESR